MIASQTMRAVMEQKNLCQAVDIYVNECARSGVLRII